MTTPVQRQAWRALALLAVVGAAAASNLPAVLGGSVAGSQATTREAACLPGTAVPIMASPHITPAQAGAVVYNSTPPTSGPHYAFTLAPGTYTKPIPDPLAVHALEHGHVSIRYAPDLPSATIDHLIHLIRRQHDKVILAPDPRLHHRIALTAWGRIELLNSYQPQRITAFIHHLSNRYNHGWTKAVDCPGNGPDPDGEPATVPGLRPRRAAGA